MFLIVSGCSEPLRPGEIRSAIDRGDYQTVQSELDRQLELHPDDPAWRILAARAAAGQRKSVVCREHLDRIPAPPPAELGTQLEALGAFLVRQGALAVAEKALTLALDANPDLIQPHVDLAYLLGVEGRCFEAAPHLLASVQRGEFTLHHLVLLGASDPVIDDAPLVAACLTAFPEDLLPRLGEARTHLRRDEFGPAGDILKRIVEKSPDCGEAQGRMGRLLVATASPDFSSWSRNVPKTAEQHPEVWVARGLWAEDHLSAHFTVRCFWEAIRRDSENRLALTHLAQSLTTLGREEEARPFRVRAERLRQLAQIVDEIYAHPDDLELRRKAALIAEELGRLWEARAWAASAASATPPGWVAPIVERISGRLRPGMGRISTESDPAAKLDLSSFPLPEWGHQRPTSQPLTAASVPTPAVRFAEESEKAGLRFTYRSRGPRDSGEMRMYETTGGGVAVLDYDCDGKPDLYFTQGGSLTPREQPAELNDRLFRLGGAGSFRDVTAVAGVTESAYSQGVTGGDLNNDGFADLYIGNFGRNRLLINNGDGTFDDATAIAGLNGERWTTSVLIADLSGDGHPDLYDVNYVSRDDAVRATCRHGEELRWCSPGSFAAEPDALWLSDGNGGFQEVAAAAGIDVPEGKGLGIVAADFDQSGRLSLFVANDAVPNFFFRNETAAGSVIPRFAEMAMDLGLAVDRDGLPQACMGVAAGDLDGDRLLDLFVTNFYDESNTLYIQKDGGLFADETRSAELRSPGLKMLGFGTQAIDADLDGRLDLVVTNGHVLDLSNSGIPFQMPLQLFWNQGNGKFSESGRSAGDLFSMPVRGRGLARLDWNDDGAEDFVVSHIDSPAFLATNAGPRGKGICLRLIGTTGARDGIGATITVEAGGRSLTRQLTAGDGYQCTNERQIHFGLGESDRADRMTVRWPSGSEKVIGPIEAGRTVLVPEASDWVGSTTKGYP